MDNKSCSGGLLNNDETHKLIDRIMYLSSLASSKDVEPLLDTLRKVTAGWKEGETMNPADQATLKDLEARIKKYLVTQDPLHDSTLDSLEQRVKEKDGSTKKRGLRAFLSR